MLPYAHSMALGNPQATLCASAAQSIRAWSGLRNIWENRAL